MEFIEINQMEGFCIGSSENSQAGTGCTVILCPDGAACGVDVRGGGPASRETELLKSTAAADVIHAVALCGGSAFGLDAAGGVMRYLEERHIGFPTSAGVVPLVCASSIFDLACGDRQVRPDAAMGYAACVASEANEPRPGNYGAGTGATVGKYAGMDRAMKSGLGICAAQAGNLQVGAVVSVNALGDVYDRQGRILAGMLTADRRGFANTVTAMLDEPEAALEPGTTNTTIAAVMTNAAFPKAGMNKIAALASNGLVRAIAPVNTMADGDAVYALSVGAVQADINVVGTLAAQVLQEAIMQAVGAAGSAYGLLARRDLDWIHEA